MRNRGWVCFAAALVLVAAAGCDPRTSDVPPGGTEATEAQELTVGTVYTLVGVQSGRCMNIAGSSTADLAAVQLRDCSGGTNQQFRFDSAGSGYYTIRAVGSDKCLDVTGASTSAGASIIQYTCHGGTNQQWSTTDLGNDVVHIASRASGMVLDAYGARTANGTKIIQWPVSGGTNQQFRLTAADGAVTSYTLTVATSGSGTTNPAAGTHTYASGTSVTVTATPASGYAFTGWSGAATGTTNPVTIAMDGNKTLTANFEAAASDYTLTVATAGSGSGTTNPAAGTHTYASGTPVAVTATPASGATFTGWSGAATGTANPVTITMDGNKALTASFSSAGGSCAVSSSRVRITEVDVGANVVANEDEVALKPLALSPIPSGGSRLAWMGGDGKVHVTQLDASDQVTGTSIAVAAHDFADLYADDKGGVLLLTRDAQGGGTLNCGAPTNLCGTPPSPAIPCHDMYMVRFDGAAETWATKLTSSSAALPPYSTGPSGPEVFMIWWYAHHGRIAFDGTNYAGYFGAAISVSQSGCINIHQGDRMKIVGPSGALQSGGFDWGCSHSGYERILWDPAAKKFVTVCKTDNNNRIAFAPNITTIYPVDLWYSNLGNLVLAKGGGYWLATSNIRSGQATSSNGLADVHLLHFSSGTADKDVVLASDAGLNDRAPHLATYGADRLLAAWESSTAAGDLAASDKNRKLYVQTLDAATGSADGAPSQVSGVAGNRYQEFRSFPDGSVAYPAPGSSATKVKILRILPCGQ